RPGPGGIEIALELAGRDAVEMLDFLLLSELRQVVGIALAAATLLPGAPLLPGRKRPPGVAALAGDLAGSFEPEFDAGSPGELLERSTGSHAGPIPLSIGLLNLFINPQTAKTRKRSRSTTDFDRVAGSPLVRRGAGIHSAYSRALRGGFHRHVPGCTL